MATKKTKHEHAHRCECTHARVKFCGDCKVVHCLDCKIEWSHEPCTRAHGYGIQWWNSPTYQIGAPAIGIGSVGSGGPPLDVTPTITCAHTNAIN